MANLSSASDIYNMTSTRWGGILKTLNNKKAMEDAFRQHEWQMQRRAQELAGGAEQQHIAGQYRLKEQEMQNQARGGGKSNLEYQVLTQAVEMAKSKDIDIQSPEGQQQFQQIYQALLYQATGGQGGAMMPQPEQPPPAAPNVPEPVWPVDPRRALPGYADYGVPKGSGKPIDQATAKKLLQKAGGDREKARAMARKLGYTF